MAVTAVSTEKGAKAYTPRALELYDPVVLGIMTPYAWRCAPERLVSFFNRNVTRVTKSSGPATRIMDIGVGTGYFPANAPLAKWTELVLVDLNENCLEATAPVIAKAHPEVGERTSKVVADFLAVGEEEHSLFKKGTLPEGGFDAISNMFLLHCLPGPPERKAKALVNMRHLLRPDGVLFGATILGKDVPHNLLAKFGIWFNNHYGVFGNWEDSPESFVLPLKEKFEYVYWEVVGCMLLFEASGVKA